MENTAETVKARAFSADTIKYIAIAAMVLNHLANVFREDGTMLCECLKAVGYFTAPAMIYFLVEGYYHTRSRKKYFQRLLIFGAVSEVPFCLAFTENRVIAFAGLDMILTLALCYLMIRVYQNVRNRSLQMLLYLGTVGAGPDTGFCLYAKLGKKAEGNLASGSDVLRGGKLLRLCRQYECFGGSCFIGAWNGSLRDGRRVYTSSV